MKQKEIYYAMFVMTLLSFIFFCISMNYSSFDDCSMGVTAPECTSELATYWINLFVSVTLVVIMMSYLIASSAVDKRVINAKYNKTAIAVPVLMGLSLLILCVESALAVTLLQQALLVVSVIFNVIAISLCLALGLTK